VLDSFQSLMISPPTHTVEQQLSLPLPDPPQFKFIDLFAGIGGMRIAFTDAGGECVFSSEWDRFAQQTYKANFGETPHGDIKQINEREIPAHDVLVAGFPCQPFSVAGVSKNNALGRRHGFDHETQGNLFFDIVRILKHHKPAAFLLENVKNLKGHDGGRTFNVITTALEKDLNYQVYPVILDAAGLVPQHRERTYIVGFMDAVESFDFPDVSSDGKRPSLKSLLDDVPNPKYTLSAHLWRYLRDYAEKHRAKGNGFGYGLVDPENLGVTTRTLSARYHKDGSEILVHRGPRKRPRRLSPKECARLMGFPEEFEIPVSDTQAYRQFGNSVVVPVVSRIASQIASHLK